jgi:hypothetical protein
VVAALVLVHALHSALGVLDDLDPPPEVLHLLGQLLALPHFLPELALDLLDVGPVLVHYLSLHLLLDLDYLFGLLQLFGQVLVLCVHGVEGGLVPHKGLLAEVAAAPHVAAGVPRPFQLLLRPHFLLKLQPLRLQFHDLLAVLFLLDL